MPSTLSSREFGQNVGRAKRAAEDGPVFITDRGRPLHVLLTIEEYHRLAARGASIAELLAMPEFEDVEIDIPRSTDVVRPADFS